MPITRPRREAISMIPRAQRRSASRDGDDTAAESGKAGRTPRGACCANARFAAAWQDASFCRSSSALLRPQLPASEMKLSQSGATQRRCGCAQHNSPRRRCLEGRVFTEKNGQQVKQQQRDERQTATAFRSSPMQKLAGPAWVC